MNTKAHNLSKYQLVECIAHGGMGEVWKALDTQLQRYVAIKLLHPSIQQDPNFITRFEQEARLIASLHHPNIIKIHNFHVSYPPESDHTLCYMVMDYVEGETLADYIRNTSHRQQFPPASDIIYIFTVVGLAIDYAHQHDMIHRDIKPANILLDKRVPTARSMGEPILTDFGIARQQGVTGGTIIGSVMGTPKYMAPEQAEGCYDDPRSDLYSLGIILYEVMTGEAPFHADAPLAIMMQHLREQPKPPELINPRISRSLSEVILKSIAKNPEERFPTAAALTLALTQAFNAEAPEQLGSPGGYTLSGLSFSSSSPTYVPSLGPSNGVETPFTGLPLIPTVSHLSVGSSSNASSQTNVSMQANIASLHTPFESGLQLRGGAQQSQIKKKKTWMVGLAALLLLVLVGSGLTARILLSRPSITTAAEETLAGHVSFIKNASAQNYNAVQIDIAHVSELPPGTAYYAWIVAQNGEQGEHAFPPHWELTVNQHAIHTPPLTSPGVDNLYVPNSLFLITKEQTDSPPVVPSIDPSARLYYAPMTSATLDLKQCPTTNTATVCFN